MVYKIEIYTTQREISPFSKWLDAVDIQARQRILIRLKRVRLGNLGHYKIISVGISEFKLDFSPGYRIYFSMLGPNKIIILLAGTKRTQKRDIAQATTYLEDYKSRKGNYAKIFNV